MPRMRRNAVAHFPHHIVHRGHNRQRVFRNDDDRATYLSNLIELREELALQVYGYCLMTNHVHLIVNPGARAENLGVLMKRLASRHTQRINRRTGRTGTQWDGRFKSSPIATDRYLLACLRYVDLNPVRAGIVARPEDYVWSSYRPRIGLVACEWLDLDPSYLALANTPKRRQLLYRSFVESGIEERELESIREAVRRNEALGL